MDNEFIISSLFPFVGDNNLTYYVNLETEKLTLLVSLAPFVNNPDTLMKLSKLDINILQELTGKLPQFNVDEIKKYFDKV